MFEFQLETFTLNVHTNEQGEKHREDGPAVEWMDKKGWSRREYWLNGKKIRNSVHLEYPNGVSFWDVGGKFISGRDAEKIAQTEDWKEIVDAPNAFELFLTVRVEGKTVYLQTGTFEQIQVPKKWFTPSGDGTKPDFNDVSIVDYGHGVRFGSYEASTRAILEEILTPTQKLDHMIRFIDYKLNALKQLPDRMENLSERELSINETLSQAIAISTTTMSRLEDIKQEIENEKQ